MYRFLFLAMCILALPALGAAQETKNNKEGDKSKAAVPSGPDIAVFQGPDGKSHAAQAVFDVTPPSGWRVFGKQIPETTILTIFLAVIAVLLGLVVSQLSGLRSAIDAMNRGGPGPR